jgi:hypothetical protein
VPKPIAALRGVKVDAVVAGNNQRLALADDGSVYGGGNRPVAKSGALGLGPSVGDGMRDVPMPQRIAVLRCVAGLEMLNIQPGE